MSSGTTIRSALLLLGPTGAGKTPLGELIQLNGLWGHGWAHFDFGAQMRQIVAGGRPNGPITQADVDFLRQVLQSGALLEDEHVPLAGRIFQSFFDRSTPAADAWIVLNGLPRHVGQAEEKGGHPSFVRSTRRAVPANVGCPLFCAPLVRVRAVAELACTPEVVATRIRCNVGGDRTQRVDDAPAAVRRKLEIYGARTEPLVDYYRRRGVPILRVEVTAEMTAGQMLKRLEALDKPRGDPCAGSRSTHPPEAH